MFKGYRDVVSVAEMMSMLNIGKNSAYTLIKNNVIPSIRIGRIHRIPKSNIVRYLKSTQKN